LAPAASGAGGGSAHAHAPDSPRTAADHGRQKHTGDEQFHWLLPKLSDSQTASRGSAQCAGVPNLPCIWHHFGVVSVREAAFRPGASFPNPSPEGSALRGAPFTSCRWTVRFSRTDLKPGLLAGDVFFEEHGAEFGWCGDEHRRPATAHTPSRWSPTLVSRTPESRGAAQDRAPCAVQRANCSPHASWLWRPARTRGSRSAHSPHDRSN
jgi:hypothetical protein